MGLDIGMLAGAMPRPDGKNEKSPRPAPAVPSKIEEEGVEKIDAFFEGSVGGGTGVEKIPRRSSKSDCVLLFVLLAGAAFALVLLPTPLVRREFAPLGAMPPREGGGGIDTAVPLVVVF